MPFRSQAQRRFFHTDTARRKGISKKVVDEYDAAPRGKKLPEKKHELLSQFGRKKKTRKFDEVRKRH